jgi:hypothetical protein
MPDRAPLQRILAAAAREMRADFDMSAEIEHRGSKGTVREDKLLTFLQRYLPKRVEVAGSSEIVSADGQTSGQMDIVIYDPAAPPLFHEGGYRILPAECVYAVIEVKSKLTLAELKKSMGTIAKVKAMPKTSFFPEPQQRVKTMYGREYVGFCPTVGFVFAYDSSDLRGMHDEFLRAVTPQPHELRIDGVWVLGKGGYNWVMPSPIQFLPAANPGAWLAVGDVDADQDILMNMMLVLDTHAVNAYMPPMNMIPYANEATLLTNTTLRGPAD